MFVRMLTVACVEAALAELFFMHLWSEKRAFLLFVVLFTVSVLLGMQYGWTDSFRMVIGRTVFQMIHGDEQVEG